MKFGDTAKLVGMVAGLFTIFVTLIIGAFKLGEITQRQQVLLKITDLKEQIRSRDELLSSAYTLRPVTDNISLRAGLRGKNVEVDRTLLLSIQYSQETPIVVIRRTDGTELARHHLCYYAKDTLRYYINTTGGPIYFFAYYESGGEDWVNISKAVRLTN